MSDRTKNQHMGGSTPEAIDLTEVRAPKAQGDLRVTAEHSANTDLAQASIQSTNFVRIGARPEKRTQLSSLTSSHVTSPTKAEISPASSRPAPARQQRHGILKNPYFPYQGGLLERLITFIANILKALETALLSALRQPFVMKPVKPSIKTMPVEGRETEQAKRKKQRDERRLQPRRE